MTFSIYGYRVIPRQMPISSPYTSCFHSSESPLVFSIIIGRPFLISTVKNRYPSRVFVGDTYTYFAGMTFAVVGILGHFSKTIILFFIPQIFNSAYSVPQIFGLIPCPRHRLPRLNHKTGKLEPSYAEFKKPLHPLLARALRLLAAFRLIRIYTVSDPPPVSIPGSSVVASNGTLVDSDRDPDEIIACSNLTIINLVLVLLGPMREDHLCLVLLGIQVLCGGLGFVIRHRLAYLIYDRGS